MDKARVYVDFNELVEKDIVLLSKDDWKTDSNGERVRLEVGYLSFDNAPNVSVCISAQKELGFFISITDDENTYLTLGDKNTLNETVDVWGDGLYISKGLFIPFSIAWKDLEEYLIFNKLSDKINWITSDEIPEDGNFIC